MDPYDILEEIDEKGREENEQIYKKVYDEFIETTGENYRLYYNKYSDRVREIKDNYIYTSKYNKLFFELLEKYNYHMEQEILDAIFDIVYEKRNKDKIIKKYILSPVINDISLEERGKIKIYSTFGDFNYILAEEYFKDNKLISNYMKKNQLRNRCHDNTYFLSRVLKEYYTIASLCKSYFTGYFHHSYTYDNKNNYIIDLCRKSLIDKKEFDRLYEPKEIIRIKNSDVEKKIEFINRKTNMYDICEILKIALYEESNNKKKVK